MTVQDIRWLSRADAFAQLPLHPEIASNVSAAARQWGCSRSTARAWLAEFASPPLATMPLPPIAMAAPEPPPPPPWQSGTAEMAGDAGRASGGKVSVEDLQMAGETATTAPPPAPIAGTTGAVGDGTSVTSGIDVAAYVAAVALAIVAAVFSIRGMLVLFPGAPIAIIVMAAAMEVAKLVAVAWLARNWRRTGRVARTVLVVLVTGLAIINAEKLRKIEALFAGAGTTGERLAAEAALERVRARLTERGHKDSPVEMQFSMPDQWSRHLFLALCRRYGLSPYPSSATAQHRHGPGTAGLRRSGSLARVRRA